jgi:hypothetical protein
MDWYSLIEVGIADRLRAELTALDYFTKAEQVSDNDAQLNFGGEYFIILRPGPFPFVDTSYKTGEIQSVDWQTFIHLYVRFHEKAEQWGRFKPFRNAVIQTVMKHRFLNAVTIGSTSYDEVKNIDRIRNVNGADQPGYFRFFGIAETMPPNFMTQALSITARQRVRFE